MKHRTIQMLAWFAVLSVVIAGNAFAQATRPSLVTQQTRLSTGGATPAYVQQRAKVGILATTDPLQAYNWDQAPIPAGGTFYTFFLDDANNIERSSSFGLTVGAAGTGAPGYLLQVNAAGNGTDWIKATAIVGANNGLVLDLTTNPGTAIVQLGDSATGTTGQGALSSNRFVHMAGKDLSFEGSGNMNLGTSSTDTYNLTIDPGTAGNLMIKDLATDDTVSHFLVIDGASHDVRIRDLSSLVVADNGLSINPVGGFVELGAATAAGASAAGTIFTTDRFVDLGTKSMNWQGTGNYNIGDGTGVEAIKLDPSSTGTVQLKNIPDFPTPTNTDRILMLDPTSPTGDRVWTRSLSSLVNANEGLVVDITTNPGTSIVQLGDTVDGGNPINNTRFITMTGATPSLTYDGTGTLNLGTSGNLALNINTGTQNTTLQSTVLDNAANANNFLWVDTLSNEVHRARTSALGRDDSPIDFLAVDHTTGNIVRAVSPVAGIIRGHVAWTAWNQTFTLPGTFNLDANASITLTIDNRNSEGTVAVQITSTTTGLGGSFTIAAADDPPAGAFINYVVMNP